MLGVVLKLINPVEKLEMDEFLLAEAHGSGLLPL